MKRDVRVYLNDILVMPALICLILVAAPHLSYSYGLEPICPPLEIGFSWTYLSTVTTVDQDYNATVQIDTVTVTVVGTEKIGLQEYYVLNNGELYRTSEEGEVWWYNSRSGQDELFCDICPGEKAVVEYEGVFRWEQVHILRTGPFEITIGDSSYSDAYSFEMQAPEGIYVVVWVVGTGIVEYYWAIAMFPGLLQEHRELIHFSRRPTVIGGSSWGQVKSAFGSKSIE